MAGVGEGGGLNAKYFPECRSTFKTNPAHLFTHCAAQKKTSISSKLHSKAHLNTSAANETQSYHPLTRPSKKRDQELIYRCPTVKQTVLITQEPIKHHYFPQQVPVCEHNKASHNGNGRPTRRANCDSIYITSVEPR